METEWFQGVAWGGNTLYQLMARVTALTPLLCSCAAWRTTSERGFGGREEWEIEGRRMCTRIISQLHSLEDHK